MRYEDGTKHETRRHDAPARRHEARDETRDDEIGNCEIKTPRPPDTIDETRNETNLYSGEHGETARFFLSCLYECVIYRVAPLHEQYGELGNKATNE